MIFLLVLTAFSASKHFTFYDELVKKRCSDSYTNEKASLFGVSLTKYLIHWNIGIAVILGFSIISEILYGFWVGKKFGTGNIEFIELNSS